MPQVHPPPPTGIPTGKQISSLTQLPHLPPPPPTQTQFPLPHLTSHLTEFPPPLTKLEQIPQAFRFPDLVNVGPVPSTPIQGSTLALPSPAWDIA
ncbi:hypothetical protein AAC387_Pa06g1415 [Persea americana]